MASQPARPRLIERVGEKLANELRILDDAPELPIASTGGGDGAGVEDLRIFPRLLPQVYREIEAILLKLKASRRVIQSTPLGELQHTNEKLRQVTATTEVAAADIMDAVDRAFTKIDQLETKDGADLSEEAGVVRAELRDELYAVMNHLQFQDITTQQIHHSLSIISEMESRLEQLTELFQVKDQVAALRLPEPVGPVTFDPHATTGDADVRQALADELFQ